MKETMQIYVNLLRVLFVLSTIVFMTDCCSSKVMLLKEQVLHYQQQQQQQQIHDMESNNNNKHIIQFPDQIDTIVSPTQQILQYTLPNVNLELTTEIDFGKIANYPTENNNNNNDDDYNDDMSNTVDYTTLTDDMSTTVAYIGDGIQLQNATQDQEERDAEHNFDMLDKYYNIMRDVLSYECTGEYLTDFCLNRGRCFRYPVGKHSFYSCECADGFVGERCESKSLNGYYVPHRGKRSTRPKILTARVFFSFPMLIVISLVHVTFGLLLVVIRTSKVNQHHRHRRRPRRHLTEYDAATVTAVIG